MAASDHVTELIRKIPLDRDAICPLHQQIFQGIQSMIARGDLRPGDRVPNVADLSRHCGVSKSTAMQAVSELRRKQLLTAKRWQGTHVAPMVQKTTEVFFGSINLKQRAIWDFLEQVLDGVREGYDDPNRRIVPTVINGFRVNASEILAIAEVRGTDGMVFYNPTDETADMLREVAKHFPCASLIRPLPNSRADCVTFDVEAVIQVLMGKRIQAGKRDYSYVGHLANLNLEDPGPYYPYTLLYEALFQCLHRHGIELNLILSPVLRGSVFFTEDSLIRRAIDLIPERSVVIAQTGTIATKLAAADKGFDIITYTEYRKTLEACIGKVSVLYAGLELLGAAAAKAIQERIASPKKMAGRVIRVEPKVISADEPSANTETEFNPETGMKAI